MGKSFLAVLFAAVVATGATATEQGFGTGGIMIGVVTLDLTELNVALSGAHYPELPQHVLVIGGGGGGGVTGGPAFGGLGFSGTTDAMIGQQSVVLDLSFGGMTVERVERAAQRVLLGFGAVLGGGSLQLTVRSRYPEDFADAITDPTTVHLSRGFLGGMVHVRMQIQLLEWMSLEGWAGYMAGFPGRWKDRDREIAGGEVDVMAPFFGIRLGLGGIDTVRPPEMPDILPDVPAEPEVEPEVEPEPEPEPEVEEDE